LQQANRAASGAGLCGRRGGATRHPLSAASLAASSKNYNPSPEEAAGGSQSSSAKFID